MNTLLIVVCVIVFVVAIYIMLFRKSNNDFGAFEEDSTDKYTEAALKLAIIDEFDKILQTDYSTLNLNKYETLKNERNRSKLRISFRSCSCGNLSSKLYVKDYIRDLLQRKLGIDETTINETIPFDNKEQLTAQDKFEILLFQYKQKYDLDAFSEMINRNGLATPIGDGSDIHYEITKRDIDLLYSRHSHMISQLSFYDKLDILTQRIYQVSYGLGAIDEIRDMNIDGLNCGTSGIPNTFYMYGADARYGAGPDELPLTSYNAIWLMYHGKLVHLSFLGFQTQRELERVSKLVYRYDNPGTLDASTGYMVNFMQDGSRVAVARPPMAESWMFFIRKFDTASKMSIYDLYPFEGNDKLVDVIHWITTGCRNIAITGEQATGKSTFLVSLIQFVAASYGIRVEEMAFELHLRKIYPKRNIATFRDTGTVSAQEGIDFQKKTDGTINVFGEIAQAAVAALAIQQGQVGAAQVVFTHHAKTVVDLIEAFRDNMIEAAGFNNERIVEKTVARVLNFDIHLNRTVSGMRYIERITMILPKSAETYPTNLEDAQKAYYYRQTDRQIFDSADIIVFENNKYVFKNNFTPEVIADINRFLSDSEKSLFAQLVQQINDEIGGAA